MKIRLEVNEGEIMPNGFGMAYPNTTRLTYVLYPIPINWLMRFLKMVYDFMRQSFLTRDEKRILNAYRKGYNEGYEYGYKQFEKSLNNIEQKLNEIH